MIYILDNTNTGSNINNLITAPTTLNIGKKSGIFDNDNYNVEILEILLKILLVKDIIIQW